MWSPSEDSRLLLRQEVEKKRAEDIKDVGLVADHIPGDREKSLGGSIERMGNRLDKRINRKMGVGRLAVNRITRQHGLLVMN